MKLNNSLNYQSQKCCNVKYLNLKDHLKCRNLKYRE